MCTTFRQIKQEIVDSRESTSIQRTCTFDNFFVDSKDSIKSLSILRNLKFHKFYVKPIKNPFSSGCPCMLLGALSGRGDNLDDGLGRSDVRLEHRPICVRHQQAVHELAD